MKGSEQMFDDVSQDGAAEMPELSQHTRRALVDLQKLCERRITEIGRLALEDERALHARVWHKRLLNHVCSQIGILNEIKRKEGAIIEEKKMAYGIQKRAEREEQSRRFEQRFIKATRELVSAPMFEKIYLLAQAGDK